jgi:hypothetical protein
VARAKVAQERPGRCNALHLTNQSMSTNKLVSAKQLLDQLFAPECRPSLRWLRNQTKAKAIPYVRIGRLVFFDVEMVRNALASKNLVRGRMLAVTPLAKAA